MSQWSSGSQGISGTGIMLPVPKISLIRNPTTDVFFVYSRITGSMAKVQCSILAQAVVLGFSDELLNNVALYEPKLELLRVTRRTSTRSELKTGARSAKNASWVHPSNAPLTSGDGSNVQGGVQRGTDQIVFPFRQSEWPVSTHGQVVDMTQGMLGYMSLGRFDYRDVALNKLSFDGLASSRGIARYKKLGKTVPYQAAYSPGRFEFRWSIIDPQNERGRRITGPSSATFTVTNDIFPLVPDFTDIASGQTTAALRADYISNRARIFLAPQRLPR